LETEPIWNSDFLRGGDAPVETNVNLRDVKELTFVADSAHEGRPAGADPLDIRDDVVWLRPLLKLSAAAVPQPHEHFAYWFPALQDWEIPVENAQKYILRGAWERGREGCVPAFIPNPKSGEAASLVFRRKVKITVQNARFLVEAARDSKGKSGHEMQVFVGEKQL
jgi:hypothetical protein